MKVLFCHLGRENLGIEYLSSVLKQAGHRVSLAFDPGLFGINDNVFNITFLEKLFEQKKKVFEKILDFKPDIVAFSAYTDTYQWCCSIAERIKKELAAKIVFGGIHPTLVPERVMAKDFIDFVIVGEAEYSFLELLQSLESGQPIEQIKNLCFKQDGRIIKNELREPMEDISSLGFPDKELFEKDFNYRDDYLIITSRGCLFSCSYCCESFINRLYHNRFFRRRSVDSIMEELIYMKKRYNYRRVRFIDSVFFTDKKWLKALLERFKQEIGVKFWCFGKVQFLDEEVAELLRWAGCYGIEFGVQATNEDLRRAVLTRFETDEQNKKAFKICDDYKLRYDIDHMFGLPGEKEQDWIKAAEFYSRLKNLNRIKCHNLVYFPRLEIINAAKQDSILSEDDIENIEEGRIVGSFFHPYLNKDKESEKVKKDFENLYKMLPLFRPSWTGFIIGHRLYKIFHFIPSFLIMFLQVIVAFKGRDPRFMILTRYYLLYLRKRLKRVKFSN
ncbi:MAG: B12-binding domain-containing radical SAM protein [Candidatus Omnitrophica bacterium]|nr:B12-binding domain-containing radical SAM protein [Candidatus Omnitrophota bacterium]